MLCINSNLAIYARLFVYQRVKIFSGTFVPCGCFSEAINITDVTFTVVLNLNLRTTRRVTDRNFFCLSISIILVVYRGTFV